MNKSAVFIARAALAVVLFASAMPAEAAGLQLSPRVEYALTTDFPGLFRGDLQLEFVSTIATRTSWAVRAGYFKHRQASSLKYDDGRGRWEIGFRWRAYLVQDAPHWLFLGVGWNNRPQDTQVTPLAELGFSLNAKPVSVTALGFYGYELYLKARPGFQSAWVKGFEVRAGVCF